MFYFSRDLALGRPETTSETGLGLDDTIGLVTEGEGPGVSETESRFPTRGPRDDGRD